MAALQRGSALAISATVVAAQVVPIALTVVLVVAQIAAAVVVAAAVDVVVAEIKLFVINTAAAITRHATWICHVIKHAPTLMLGINQRVPKPAPQREIKVLNISHHRIITHLGA